MNLYVTWDNIGSNTGGGSVTFHELQALKELGEPVEVINPPMTPSPFDAEEFALNEYRKLGKQFKIAHFYAGTYSRLIDALKNDGTKISFTSAAHSVQISKEEFEKLGMVYNHPHLTDPGLFKEYIRGYHNADIMICPSTHSYQILQEQGCRNICVIPHGHAPPTNVKLLPKKLIVGYLGQTGPDKGLIYLIKAWKIFNCRNSVLMIAGRGTEELISMVRSFGSGNIHLMGYVESIADLYNTCSIYCQPSASEGFGIEVLEAMSYGRTVVCSEGAGAVDCLSDFGIKTKARDVYAIAAAFQEYKDNLPLISVHGEKAQKQSVELTWDKIKKKYIEVWRNL